MESRYFNSLLHYIAENERFNAEMRVAKPEFEQFVGGIVESDREYAARINSFHNWYILDRPMASGMTPLSYFLEFNANSYSQEELTGYQELAANVHSVFELLKRTRDQTWLYDLLTKKKHAVEGSEDTSHVDPGTLFNARLFLHGGKVYFSNYMVPHPNEVAKDIKRVAKRVRKSKADPKPFLFQLVLFHHRWNQYRQFEARNIYRFDV